MERTRDLFGPRWVFPAYLAAVVVFFLPALLPGRQIYGTDYLGSTFFWESFATERFAAGELPSWLPHVYGGVPFFANPMDVYYPVSVAFRLVGVPTHVHLALLFVIQFFLAGMGMYLLVRELGGRAAPAAVAGALYMFNGYLVSLIYGGHDNRAIVATLLPLVFFALHAAVRTGKPRWFGFSGLVVGAALLPFQIQSSYYLLLAAGLWFGYLILRLRRTAPLPLVGRRVVGGAAALVIGFLLSAVNFLPFLGYIGQSPRGGDQGRGYDYSVTWSMPPEEFVGVAVPERSGILGEYVGENPFKLHMEYSGALVLLLCLMGGYVLRGRRVAWFFPALAAFGLTLAFGGYTPLYRLYYALLPGISRFRAPASAFFLVSFALVVFGALALDRMYRLREEDRSEERPDDEDVDEMLRSGGVLAGLGAILALVWAIWVTVAGGQSLSGAPTAPGYVAGTWRFALFTVAFAGVFWLWARRSLPSSRAMLLLLALGAADLWTVDREFLHTVPEPDVYFAPDPVAQFLAAQPGVFRVNVLDDLPQDNYLTYFGIELVAGEHGNQIQTYNEFLGASDSTYTDKRNLELHPFLDLANVRYLVTSRSPRPDLGAPVFRGTHRGEAAAVYENVAALPRAFLVSGATRVSDPGAMFERMTAPDFDPGAEALIYDEPRLPVPAQPGADRSGTADITGYSPTEVVVAVAVEAPAYLVLSNTYHEDWSVEVDGEPRELIRAYHTFQSVALPPGEHEVRFRFRSSALGTGFFLSLLTWAGLLVGGVVLWRQDRSAAGEPVGAPARTEETGPGGTHRTGGA
jgi:hypothetical protein